MVWTAGYAWRVQEAEGVWELGRPDFLTAISELLAIYAAAMGAERDELPTRRAIMERHAANPGFRALAVISGDPARIVAFTYGFRGVPGQWWRDVVRAASSRARASPLLRTGSTACWRSRRSTYIPTSRPVASGG